MLDPAPTTVIDAELCRAKLLEIREATATTPTFLVMAFDNTSYETHLEPYGQMPEWLSERVGKRVVGTIRGSAKRIDNVETGGKFVDPVHGRPRRIQGRVVACNPSGNTVTIDCGMAVVVKPTAPGQKAGDFAAGDFVACDIQRGATFEGQR